MWHDAIHIETVLGAEIVVDDAGEIDLLIWYYAPHPLSPTVRDLAGTERIEA